MCTDCHSHENHQVGGILYKWQKENKKVKQYKEPPFMNILRRRTFTKYPEAEFTYGSETTSRRKELGLEKTHYNDAIVISGIDAIKENSADYFYLKQFRKKKRSLHESVARKGRKLKNITQKRNAKNTKSVKGWCLNDSVRYNGEMGWICGFTGSSARVRNISDEYLQAVVKNYTQISLRQLQFVNHNNGWRYSYR